MNATRSHDAVAADLGISRQRVAVTERRALEKLHLLAVLRADFPILPGETFAEWFGTLRACAKVLANRSAVPAHNTTNIMDPYKQIGTPAVVSGDSNSSDASTAVKNRLLGIPTAAPQSSFVGVIIAALYAMAETGAGLIDTLSRKVSVTNDDDGATAFDDACDAGAHVVTLTADDLQAKTPNWAIDDVAELEAIYGEDEATLLRLSTFNSGRSPESAMNALVNKLGVEGKAALVSLSQKSGEIKVATFANDGALTTAANTAREETAGESVFVTVNVPAPTVEVAEGPVWGY